jgi:16S rRNA pseudouridine516 synthase
MKALPATASVFTLLRAQEFGGRKECLEMLKAGAVEWARDDGSGEAVEREDLVWTTVTNPDTVLETEGLWLRYNGLDLPVLSGLFIVLNKPAGVECSRNSDAHDSVFEFFPDPFLKRGLQPVGRLDADTTGLLLLTDDGLFNHAVISPRRKLPKTYRVGLKHPLTDTQIAALEAGVVLRDDPAPTLPAIVRKESDRVADIIITEGRYHQIKRMCAAVGNRVESIHRTAVGALELGDLPEGQWRFLTESEVALFDTLTSDNATATPNTP